MTAPGALLELLDGAAVGIFGILLSAAFCPIRWTEKNAGHWRAAPPGCWRCRASSTLVPVPRLPSTFTHLSPTCRCMSCWCCSADRRSGRWWRCSRLICAVRCGAGGGAVLPAASAGAAGGRAAVHPAAAAVVHPVPCTLHAAAFLLPGLGAVPVRRCAAGELSF